MFHVEELRMARAADDVSATDGLTLKTIVYGNSQSSSIQGRDKAERGGKTMLPTSLFGENLIGDKRITA
jgi:hypothetical protein